ncbi:uncharacterized protein LOC144091525 [Stigmatopora argus]
MREILLLLWVAVGGRCQSFGASAHFAECADRVHGKSSPPRARHQTKSVASWWRCLEKDVMLRMGFFPPFSGDDVATVAAGAPSSCFVPLCRVVEPPACEEDRPWRRQDKRPHKQRLAVQV